MIIVTGGAGFIGSNIIKKLNKFSYHDILVVDNLKDGTKYINLLDLKITDYLDKEDFIKSIFNNKKFGNIKAVFHEGACSSTTEWDGKYMMQNNYQFSKELLHYCMKRTIPFLYASSAAIYGCRTKYFIEERQYEQPLNIYGYSKFMFDQYVRTLIPQAKSQICGVRYFNVYGPHEEHKGNMASIVFKLNNQINSGKNPTLFFDSKNFKRDFIYVDDVVAVNIWCWEHKVSGIFNCGTGKAESFQAIVDYVIAFHQKGQLELIQFPEKLKGHYQTYTQADLTKLRTIGYHNTFKTIKKGINEYLCWLNQDH